MMKKLNNKGYMLVEIIIASVIALVIAYFLIDITIKMVNSNNDYYVDSLLTADKNVITKEIMDDFNNPNLKLTKVEQRGEDIDLTFTTSEGVELPPKTLKVSDDGKTITYGNYVRNLSDEINIDTNSFKISAECTNGEEIDSGGNCRDSNNKANIILELPAHTNYNSENYGIEIVIPYTTGEVVVDIPNPVTTSGKCGANIPELTDGLIPVYYDYSTGKWLKANITNEAEHWYNYCDSKWANAVLVTSTNRNKYVNATKGTEIKNEDMLAFYVWIPRYKYEVWNINKVAGYDSYGAQNKGVNIVFEEGNASTGTISCEYSYKAPSSNANQPNETCTGSNGDYYTHPAFKVGNTELKGFWMAKFEMSGEKDTTNKLITKVTILPSVAAMDEDHYYDELSDKFNAIINMQKAGNIYGLSTDTTKVESHMINNMEWGAVVYLTYSQYGLCDSNGCADVAYNPSAINGRSGGAPAGDVENSSAFSYLYNERITEIDSNTGTEVSYSVQENKDNWSLNTSTNVWTSYNNSDMTATTQLIFTFKVTQNGYLSFDYVRSSSYGNKVNYSMTKDGVDYTVSGAENTNSKLDFGEFAPIESPDSFTNIWIKLTPGTYTLKFYYRGGAISVFDNYTERLYIRNIEVRQGDVSFKEKRVGEMASTTGNIYGVYDMSGGLNEWIWCNMSSVKGSFVYSTTNGFNDNSGNDLIQEEAEFFAKYDKYLTKYAYGTTYNDQTAFNRTRLGDAIGEVGFLEPEIDYGFTDSSGNTTWYYTGRRGWFGDELGPPFSHGQSGAIDSSLLIRGGKKGASGTRNALSGISMAIAERDHANTGSTTARAVLTVY